MARILVVDDEKVMVKGIRFNLENEGYQVDVGYDGQQAVDMARTTEYDLIILDLMMPGLDGLSACMEIRSFSTVPIIMLTARGEDTDKLLGFEYGADDYITKPFNILEVKARIKALLRRSAAPRRGPAGEGDRLRVGTLVLDSAARTTWRSGEPVELTAKEFDLLELLMKNPDRVYSREQLLNLVWGYEYTGEYRTVDVHIRRLREKVEADPAKPSILCTKWGVGYYLKGEGKDG
ncbi:MAG: response regulator transcription factor [Ruminiclostridium sp.]|jgi:two-component system response regulator VicR|nr:response regulator transcription factor [Ruminiclostridium sp.]